MITMKINHRDCVGPMVPPPLWYAAGLLAGWLISVRFPIHILPDAVRWAVGAFCVLVGLAFVAPAVASFARAKTSVLPIRPTTALVQAGPYRLTRNPMYVGLAFAFAGIALIVDWVWALAMLPIVLAIVYVAAIKPEEHFLEGTFGPDYAAYRSRVRRWL